MAKRTPTHNQPTISPASLPPRHPDAEIRILSKAEVLERVGKTFPTLWAWMRQGKFPRARDLNGAPVWIKSEIADWISRLPIKQYRGDE